MFKFQSSPPMAQHPIPISETKSPLLPKVRICIVNLLNITELLTESLLTYLDEIYTGTITLPYSFLTCMTQIRERDRMILTLAVHEIASGRTHFLDLDAKQVNF